jgi:hypothetical protein
VRSTKGAEQVEQRGIGKCAIRLKTVALKDVKAQLRGVGLGFGDQS